MSWPADQDLDIIVEVYLGADPTADPSTWPAATDLSSRLMRQPMQIRRGRSKGQKTLSSGSCTFWLENTDGALTPLLPTSTYYPDWDLGVPMRVSVDNVGPNPPHVRFAGFVADVQARMVPGTNGENISAVQVTLGGVWRRISQGAVAKSPLRRTILASSPVAYWPIEDGTGATQIASGLAGGPSLGLVAPTYVDLANDSTCAGSAPNPLFTASANTAGGGLTAVSLAQFGATASRVSVACEFTAYLPSTPVSTLWDLVRIECTGSSSAVLPQLYIQVYAGTTAGVRNATFGIDAYDPTNRGATTFGLGIDPFDGNAHSLMCTWEQSGGNVLVTLKVDGITGTQFINAGTMGTPTALSVLAPKGGLLTDTVNNTGSSFSLGHLAVWISGSPLDPNDASRGYPAEQAHVRAARVCAEEGIPYSGTALLSNECGPQPIADVTEVLVDLEAVDHGMIVEDFAWGLNYRASSQRENLNPAMTIDLSTYRTTAGTQDDVLTPVRNDQRTRNEWTIGRPSGSSATAKDTTHQAKRGRYNDSADVNVANDTRLVDEAQWRVHEGTFDGLRYQTVPLDIAANADQ